MISTEYTVDNETPQAIPLQEDPKNLISSMTCLSQKNDVLPAAFLMTQLIYLNAPRL